jgi:hypothetical protein
LRYRFRPLRYGEAGRQPGGNLPLRFLEDGQRKQQQRVQRERGQHRQCKQADLSVF